MCSPSATDMHSNNVGSVDVSIVISTPHKPITPSVLTSVNGTTASASSARIQCGTSQNNSTAATVVPIGKNFAMSARTNCRLIIVW